MQNFGQTQELEAHLSFFLLSSLMVGNFPVGAGSPPQRGWGRWNFSPVGSQPPPICSSSSGGQPPYVHPPSLRPSIPSPIRPSFSGGSRRRRRLAGPLACALRFSPARVRGHPSSLLLQLLALSPSAHPSRRHPCLLLRRTSQETLASLAP
uniref:Uncharacterized protein n=1 Tax=Oryza punctata TaxID=4537 RepID=A0A0E0LFA6_ORYPU